MRKIKNKVCLIFLISIGLFSCTKDFESINSDPNHPTKVEPDFLFTSSILNTMNLYGGSMNRVVFFNYTQHFSGFQGEFQRYTYSDVNDNTYWANTYIDCLQPLNQIEESYKNDPTYHNRVIIANIWKNYILSNTVSIWGNVPTDKALLGTSSVPYQKEKDIYFSLLDNLKVLADSINLSGDKYSSAADQVYQGDLLKWKKFATTLRLKLAIRISNAAPNGDPAKAKEVIEEIAGNENNTIISDSETAAAKWGTTSDTWNPLYDEVVYKYSANVAHIPVACESMMYYTLPYGDPRITVFAQPAKQGPQIGKYFGQNISYGGGGLYSQTSIINPHTGLKQDDYSYIGERFLKPDAEFVFLSYAESCFLKSEAALKGWWNNNSASANYYKGIDASFTHYGLGNQAAAYKETPGIKWGTSSDTVGRKAEFYDWLQISTSYIPAGDYERQIAMQYWLAIPMQEVDAWALIRRTRLLDLEPQFATYSGDFAYVPNRIPYPSSEYKTNPNEVKKAVENLNGPDDLNTKLWFAKPIVKNQFLPH